MPKGNENKAENEAGNEAVEELGNRVSLIVSPSNRFGTDALLLADFAEQSGNGRAQEPVCDLGTGCGIIPMLLYRNGRERRIYGVDIQPQAIDQFQRTLVRNGQPDNVHALCADLRHLPSSLTRIRFRTVIMNPPYKPSGTGILSKSEADQIARHETACTTEDVVRAAGRLLVFGGRLVICGRPERLAGVMTAFQAGHMEPKRLRFVQKTPETAPWLFLLEGRFHGKPYLNVDPPLIIQDEKGGPSTELNRALGPYHRTENKE